MEEKGVDGVEQDVKMSTADACENPEIRSDLAGLHVNEMIILKRTSAVCFLKS